MKRRNLFEAPPDEGLPQVISLGAGVQSSVLALMAAHGEFGTMPEFAIFADTRWEPRAVYDWLQWLEEQLPFPVVRVSNGDLRADQLAARVRGRAEDGERWASLPYYTWETGNVREGRIRRQCTAEYKIQPIENYLKHHVLQHKPRTKLPKTPQLIQWRGISYDEMQRAKYSTASWYDVRYPLLELRMTRGHCLEWMKDHHYPQPPRSSCLGCPFHSDEEWLRIKGNANEWHDVVAFDRGIRKAGGMRGDTYLHRSCLPLDEVVFHTAEVVGQMSLLDECEGMCGT